MKRACIWVIVSVIGFLSAKAGEPYRTQIFKESIKTLLIHPLGFPIAFPVLDLYSDARIQLSFDDLVDDQKTYYYKIIHCNANWQPSNLALNEYADGFSSNRIDDVTYSFNTTISYVHYSLQIPNNEVHLKVSGNYVVVVYESGAQDKPVLTASFQVVEQQLDISSEVVPETDIDVRRAHQQVNFLINFRDYKVNNPQMELNAVIRQNGRIDNEKSQIKPTFVNPQYLEYKHNKALIFKAGNEYRHFDAASLKYNGYGIATIEYFEPYYHTVLIADEARGSQQYVFDREQNGFSLIRRINSDELDYNVEANYTIVHFSLPTTDILLTGRVFLNSQFTYNLFNNSSEMTYNFDRHAYEAAVLLKQGYHNYQYLFRPVGEIKGSNIPFEGDHWETENLYQIFIYHRPFGINYDKLIGYTLVRSRN